MVRGWSLRRKLGLLAGTAMIILLAAALGWWAYRQPKAVLFSDLSERDAAVIVAELDKLKQPYELAGNGHTIMVAADAVHRARMNLMGRPLPLHGAVGFELFNNAEFGVSDFVQKVNYQRALQGELTRTIVSIEQVQDARVHLALPEQTLFRKEGPKAKASVTVTMKPGHVLAPSQVGGIQRLVAASVPEIKFEDVAVLDQHGVVLSRAEGQEGAAAGAQLEAKQAAEQQLTRKASQLLERMFRSGDSMVAVDVTLNHQQTRVTTEEVLAANSPQKGQPPSGVVVRERSTSRESAAEGGNSGPAVTSQEIDYQTGKRTEQVVSQGGQIARLNVAVVVRPSLSEAEMNRLRQLLSAAVGLQAQRGDTIAIHSMADVGAVGAKDQAVASVDAGRPGLEAQGSREPKGTPAGGADKQREWTVSWVLAGLIVLVGLAAAALSWRQRRADLRLARRSQALLSPPERDALLQSVRQWLSAETGRG